MKTAACSGLKIQRHSAPSSALAIQQQLHRHWPRRAHSAGRPQEVLEHRPFSTATIDSTTSGAASSSSSSCSPASSSTSSPQHQRTNTAAYDAIQTGYLPGQGTPEKLLPPSGTLPGSSGEAFPRYSGAALADVIQQFQFVKKRGHDRYFKQEEPKSACQDQNHRVPLSPWLPETGASVLSSPCYNKEVDKPIEEILPPGVNENSGRFLKDDVKDAYHECWTVHGGMVIGADQFTKNDHDPLPAYKGKLIEEDFEVSGVTGSIVARKFKGIDRPGGGVADGHPEVAPGWFQFENREGRKWYLHPWSGRSQWKHPVSGEVDNSPISWYYKRPADNGLPGRPWFAYIPRLPWHIKTLNQDRIVSPLRAKARWWIYSHQAWFFYALMFLGPFRAMQPETFGNGYEYVKAPTQRELDWGRGSALVPSEKFENWIYSLFGYETETDEMKLRKYSFDCMEESFWYKHHVAFETGQVEEPRKRIFNFIRLEDD